MWEISDDIIFEEALTIRYNKLSKKLQTINPQHDSWQRMDITNYDK